ncbi:unnamed protein product [Sphagnum tenellum]
MRLLARKTDKKDAVLLAGWRNCRKGRRVRNRGVISRMAIREEEVALGKEELFPCTLDVFELFSFDRVLAAGISSN